MNLSRSGPINAYLRVSCTVIPTTTSSFSKSDDDAKPAYSSANTSLISYVVKAPAFKAAYAASSFAFALRPGFFQCGRILVPGLRPLLGRSLFS